MGQTLKRTKSPEEALKRLMALCARSERSSGDALRLMRGWGMEEAEARKVLDRLVRERFIDDSRYADLFVRAKINLSGGGAGKIRLTLRQKGVAQSVIDEAMEQLADKDMGPRLEELLRRKLRSVKGKSPFDVRTKLIRYALSQGYEFGAARECAEHLVTVEEEW